MYKQIIVLGTVVSLVSAVWWYYPTLQDMRDTSHRDVKCDGLYEHEKFTIEEAEFVYKNCRRHTTINNR
jgi:hypothetical protein